MQRDATIILGTGFAAFGAGYHLESQGQPYVVYDKNPYYGGHTASFKVSDNWIFDDGPHVSFTRNDRVQEILADAVKGAYETVPMRLNNYWRGHWFTHPVQVNLSGLPTDLVVKILVDFVDAHQADAERIRNYEEWCRAAFGTTFAETFPLAYARKYHTTPAANLTTEWLGPRMYRPNLEEIIRGALTSTPVTDVHYVTHFRYPSYGGYAAYLSAWAERASPNLEHRLVGLDPAKRELRFANGVRARYDRLLSSIPLPDLVPLIDGVPGVVLGAAGRLAFTTVVIVNLGVDRTDLSDAHVSYFYDDDILFSRLSFPHLLSPHTVPPGAGAIQAEVYFSDKYKPLTQSPKSIAERVIADLLRCQVLRPEDTILVQDARVVRYGNVIYDHERADAVSTIHAYLDGIQVAYCGRYGDWNHAWTDEAFLSGEAAAQRVLNRN